MFDIFIMDMGGHDVSTLTSRFPHAKVVRYFGNHLSMIKKINQMSRTEWYWVLSSCCDYTGFDFHWYPPPGQEYQIHCWASGSQKNGDTFLINKSNFKDQESIYNLAWYRDINYHENGVYRHPWPVVSHRGNDLASAILETEFTSLYTIIKMNGCDAAGTYEPSLWENRPIVSLTNSGSVVMCPRDAKIIIDTQAYDYPHIIKIDADSAEPENDIVFISYDESNADENWEKLKEKFPRAKRVHGVSGLFAAMKAAAKVVDTPWFYAVFGKTEIEESFQFDHQPDYLQHPANYIFHAYNPILDYSYGHGAIVMYDTKWVTDVESYEIDFTMSHHTVIIPELSCVNRVDIDPWSAWRTAFREVYKLCYLLKKEWSAENEKHLKLWLESSNTDNGVWSMTAARDAFQSFHNGEQIDINDWQSLKQRFQSARK